MMRTLSVMLAALAVPLGQITQSGADPRVLEKLDAILAKLDEILKLMQKEIKHQEDVRVQNLARQK